MNRSPLWRYLLIIALVIVGFLYAAPNLYGEDPAIQITSKNSAILSADLSQKLSAGLKAQNITPVSIVEEQNNSLLIRFSDTEAQLKAQDVIQALLGHQYVVALNLAPRTPEWLQALGAKPMKLGLDLRGGVHFLMQVDVKAMLKEREVADIHAMGDQMRAKTIRYSGIAPGKNNTILINFRNADAQQKAIALLRKNYNEYQFTPSKKGFNVTAAMQPTELIKLEQTAVTQNITTLRNRVNELGIAEPVIAQQGKDQISVDLPGVQDMARAKKMIGKVATIRLQLVDIEHDAATAASTGVVPFGSTLYRFEGRAILLKNQVILPGTSILNASTIMGEDGRPAVAIRAGGSGVTYFNKVTAANVGKPLATVYVETQTTKQMVDGKVVVKHRQVQRIINVATIQTALGGSFQVTGLGSMQYAKNLALLLRSGAYVAPVNIVSERLVGPTLGKENIERGVLSCEVGSLFVILFMALYYRLFGIVADAALVLNVVLLVAVMSVMGFTLTLPGIAGIVLTVGMAVDANVLINERIREELRNGVSPQAAISAGYGRAFTTIVDANVTTLIVAVVLFALGTGSVKSLAITLTIGLLLSMFTAIFFTRAIINLIYGGRPVKHLSIGIRIKDKKDKNGKNGDSTSDSKPSLA